MPADSQADVEAGTCGCSFPWGNNRNQQPDRVVQFPAQHAAHRLDKHYSGNQTTTTKYNLITFFPKSLFEQYRRVANIYFTLVAALSLTPYSPVRPWTTFLPLAIVLGVAMIKEAIEDYKRYRQDVAVNNCKVQVFNSHISTFEEKTWKDVHVGDVIMVKKDEYFPADLLFLSAENPEGICYVETMQLDGETNLKIKKSLDQTKDLTYNTISSFAGMVTCEPPNSRLYQFTGNFEVQPPLVQHAVTLPLSPAAILLRGCSLRNTSRVFGLVIYAGHDTKIFMNATQPPSKRSSIERKVDHIIFFMFGLLFSMCLTGCIYFAWWTARHMPDHWYLQPDNVPKEYNGSKPGIVAVTNFITSFILYGYLIPIALYVSIEMVKIVQSLCFIGLDRSMYYAESDTPAVARTSNLNEELGMVTTILSDKTGTLTRNVMEFFKCSIGGVAYGAGITEIERSNAERRGLKLDVADDDFDNKHREQYFNFYDSRLMNRQWAMQPNPELTAEFFRLLALCNTVIPDGPAHSIRYEAESPDEAALVVAAKVFGFRLTKRTNTILTLQEELPKGSHLERQYEVLNLLEFNSTRKRMSVIIRTPEDKIILYCKGADTVIYERLDREHFLNEQLKEVTLQHMEEFGSAGLRTLCLAYTELDPQFYDDWNERFIEAKLSMVDRVAKVDAVSEQVERNLRLLGCTAIEDKLQEGVPECIKTLAEAGIRLWVLTGDKMETAINIGYACSLITDEMTQFQLIGSCAEVEMLEAHGRFEEATQLSAERLQQQLEKVQQTIEADKGEAEKGLAMSYALIIDGKALLYALSPRLRQLFLAVGIKCAAVICCRVSPLQKAQVTALVKTWGHTTLAIGDGANDVGMIQKAHIGVGISGQEGMQAAMAADFAIAQFRFLTPLLLVHGRLSYKRITRMILFFFYKNLFYGSTIFVYNAFSLFSGQPIYNDFYMTLFNVVFTAAVPLIVGWFDRDLDKEYGLRFPFLYQEGQQNLYFSLPAIVGWLGTALLHAAIVVVMVLTGSDSVDSDRGTGSSWSLPQNGVLMFSIVIITVHLQLAIVLDQWLWLHHVAIWGSIVLWFLFLLAYGAFPVELSTDLHHILDTVGGSPSFWLTLVVVPITCVLPIFFFRAVKRQVRPALYQVVQEIAAREKRGEAVDAEGSDEMSYNRNAQLKNIMTRASNLVARKVLRQQAGARGRHRGFVPPYNTQSRVFDVNELCSAATQAGYSISASGDIMASHRQPSLAGSQSGLGPRSTAGSMMGALKALGQRQSSHIGSGLSTPTGSLPYGLGSERVSLPLSTADGASSPLPHGESSAVPPVDLVTNPVVANLEAAFNQDPRRHRRNDSRLSTMSIGSLSRGLHEGGDDEGSAQRDSADTHSGQLIAATTAAPTLPGWLDSGDGSGRGHHGPVKSSHQDATSSGEHSRQSGLVKFSSSTPSAADGPSAAALELDAEAAEQRQGHRWFSRLLSPITTSGGGTEASSGSASGFATADPSSLPAVAGSDGLGQQVAGAAATGTSSESAGHDEAMQEFYTAALKQPSKSRKAMHSSK